MATIGSTVDILINVHPDLSADDRVKLEKCVLAEAGVMAASFGKHPHALLVVFDPDAISRHAILQVARKCDPAATMV
jgi:hypothetical protein